MKDGGRSEIWPAPGWYAQLSGEQADLDDWAKTLNDPFDPLVLKLPDSTFVLKSIDFDALESADEVRSRALIIVARLNGALRLATQAQPIGLSSIIKFDAGGQRHAFLFLESAAIAFCRFGGSANLTLRGPNGEPLPASKPPPSEPQRWLRLADKNDLLAELLDHFGRADNWYDIYKTIEVAEKVVGGEKALRGTLGVLGKDLKDVRTSANHHRHFRGYKPESLKTLADAKALLAQVVRATLSAVEAHELKE